MRTITTSMNRRLLSVVTPLGLVAGLLALPATTVSADAVIVESIDRYIVRFEPGAVAVAIKADDPRAPEIARDAVADAIVDVVEADGGEVVHDYDDLPYVAVQTDDEASLWNMPRVVGVVPDMRVERALDTSLDIIAAADSDLNAAIGGARADGTGTAVAIIDDGIDRMHPFFMKNSTSRVVAEACFTRGQCPNSSDQQTGAGSAAHHPGDYHGTHVAGIAAGNSQGTSSIERGVAGNADIVAAQVFNTNGSAYTIDIDRALGWVYDEVTENNRPIASVNMSLGGSASYTGDCSTTSSTKVLVDQLASVGVTVFVAAGNSYRTTSISWPACLPNVVPVGSVTDALQVSLFSNIGVQVRDRGVVAPGSGICSSYPLVVNPTGYQCISGTSMASPHVAGLAALVKQAKPNVTVTEMKAAVRTTSAPYISDTRNFTVQRYDPVTETWYPDPVVGSITNLRLIDAWSAVGAVTSDQGELRGRLYDVTTGQRIAMPNVEATADLTSSNQVSGPAQIISALTTDAQGDYRLRLAAGSWTAQVSYANYLPKTTNAAAVTTNGSTSLDVDIEVPRGSVDGVIDQSAGPFSSVEFALEPTGSTTHAATTISVDPLPGDGAFSLPDIRIGTWSLTAVAGDFVSDPIDVTVTSGAATAIVNPIAMIQQVGTLAGTVTDSLTGLGLSGQAILIGTPLGVVGTRSPLDARITFGAGGTFSVPGVRSGEWAIDFEVPNYDTLQENVTIRTGQTENVSVALDPKPGVVQGSVSDPSATASVGVQNVVIDENINLVLAPDVPSPERSTMTLSQSLAASGGSFSITNVVPGDWTLNGTVFGYEPLPSTSVSVSPNGTADVGLLSLVRRTAVALASPDSGTAAGGTLVTIYGKHLTGVTGVSFGGVAADPNAITVVDDNEITVRTPAVAASTVNVVVTTPIGSSTETVAFTFTPVDTGGGGGGGGGGGIAPPPSSAPSPAVKSVSPSPSGVARTVAAFPFGNVSLEMSGVSGSGDITVTPKSGKPPTDAGGVVIPGYWIEITTTIDDFGQAEVCAPIEVNALDEFGLTVADLRLFHWENGERVDITGEVDTKNSQICGVASSFSPFAVGALQTRRVAGLDRYQTASAMSSEEFSPGVNVAFVVTGEKFPDALAAGAVAGRLGGPVLLTRFGSLPSSTRSELQRLRPKRVLVVGGPAVVSDAVLAEIRNVVGAVSVERVWGSDRFETSAELSAQTVAVAGGTVYVGSGLGFTEILAASAAAGRDDAPLLLVAGTGPLARVPTGVARELQRLRPSKIVIVGGSMLVSPAVVDAVRALAPSANITQVGGVDAYDTAAKIARTFSPGGTVYVATGEVFADGLAGGAVAAVNRSAMVMVPARGDLASYIGTALGLLRPQRIVVLGGPAAIAYDVENAVARYLPS